MNQDNHALSLLVDGGASPEDAEWIVNDIKRMIYYCEEHLGEQEMVKELTSHWQNNHETEREYGFPNWEQFQSLLNHLGFDLEHMQQQLNDTIRHDDY